jgi:hypothetical protein
MIGTFRRTWLLTGALLAFVAQDAAAQLGIESLLKNATDIGIYGGGGWLRPETPEIRSTRRVFTEFGFELSFAIGAQSCEAELVARPAGSHPQHLHGRSTRQLAGADSVLQCLPAGQERKPPVQPTQVVVAVKHGDSTVTQTFVPKAASPTPRDTSWLFEFGLGYSQLAGFVSGDPSQELRGSVRAAPTVAVYATSEHPLTGTFPIHLYPYLGLRSGLIQLQSVRMYADTALASNGQTMSSNVYAASGSAFQAGMVAGLVTDIGLTNLFVEGAYTWRDFPSVEWTGPNKAIPRTLPHRLNLSGTTVSVGLQISLGAAK